MAEFLLTDLPRELTPEETAALVGVCVEVIRSFDRVNDERSHICKKVHGGPIVELDDGRRHKHEPRCHDCGRDLHRPPGFDDQTWLCSNAKTVLAPGKPDSAVECGEER